MGEIEHRATSLAASPRVWRRAARCEGGDCLEVARAEDGSTLVRNSTAPECVLSFEAGTWTRFVADVKAGGFSGDVG